MTTVETFIKKGDVFVPLSEFPGDVDNPQYIEGAIELSINGKMLLGKHEWDLVDQLWAFVATGLKQVLMRCVYCTFFPDQPVRVVFDPQFAGNLVRIEIAYGQVVRTAREDRKQFLKAMAPAASEFFMRMIDLVPENRTPYEHSLSEVQTVLDSLDSDFVE